MKHWHLTKAPFKVQGQPNTLLGQTMNECLCLWPINVPVWINGKTIFGTRDCVFCVSQKYSSAFSL